MARSAYIYVVRDDGIDGEILACFTVKHEALTWLRTYNKRTTERRYDPVLFRYPDCGGLTPGAIAEPTRIEL